MWLNLVFLNNGSPYPLNDGWPVRIEVISINFLSDHEGLALVMFDRERRHVAAQAVDVDVPRQGRVDLPSPLPRPILPPRFCLSSLFSVCQSCLAHTSC